ncbi:MAG TPA: cytochrome c [Hyphomicrobiales bacterium]|nr:cytochrome c [Hyphomicrobiales bacterium]
MSFIHSPQRRWLDLAVGIVLITMLIGGSRYIFELNSDAREQQLDSVLAMQGQRISTDKGCVACHTVDGSAGVGPTWLGMWGRVEELTSGRTVVVDEEYFRRSLEDPRRQVVKDYPNVMLPYFLSEEEIQALIAFAQSLSPPP